MSKRSKAAPQDDMEITEKVTVVGSHIPIAAHFEVVTSLDPGAPFKLRLRLAPEPPAGLDPELKLRWPKPEEWARGPQREHLELLCHVANKALKRGVELGCQSLGAHLMTCMGFQAELAWGPEMETAMQTPAPGKGGLVTSV